MQSFDKTNLHYEWARPNTVRIHVGWLVLAFSICVFAATAFGVQTVNYGRVKQSLEKCIQVGGDQQ